MPDGEVREMNGRASSAGVHAGAPAASHRPADGVSVDAESADAGSADAESGDTDSVDAGSGDVGRLTAGDGERTALLSEPELIAWGTRIGREAGTPLVLALDGDLGAGKSTLARAIARGAGVEGDVPSPTFNLIFSYDTPRGVRLHHLDLYRLDHQDEVWDLGWSDLGAENDVVLIEWAENAFTLLPKPRWDVVLEEAETEDRRRVTLTPVGDPPALPPFPDAEDGR
ncbi:MAG TPA: tRNA (adenosine(37)-N6)-threonylcarbamoyltransferase complex ATPase subunit type 1 TsaE [Longimicrobiaceae bacterium]|jgi:tRNA threonylcarbamoyl adenosine modification protein YjeE|nr:tRNA (adenosine(37)-N6)-threonylcarbamoyltransferase complex ATPase subunit type 1 TsaE [Longimicrobiaceae bacterium]